MSRTIIFRFIVTALLLFCTMYGVSIAGSLISQANDVAFVLGIMLVIIIVSAWIFIGIAVWKRITTHFSQGEKS